jgi:hypothetical protein
MKMFLTVVLIASCLVGYSQSKETLLLKAWKLKSHTMSGMGKHSSLSKDTQVEFLKDGTWKSSSPWEGATTGKWSLKNDNRTLTISFYENQEKDFRITELAPDLLQLENTTKIAVYKLAWTALK